MDQLLTDGFHEEFPVVETLTEAVESILKHSFAVYKVDDATVQVIRDAWLEARGFFASPNKYSHYRVVDGSLHGFHVPSEAKLLFRAFCGSPMQPWPNDDFQNASVKVANALHRILVDCYNEILQKSANSHEEEGSASKRAKRGLSDNAVESNICPLDYFLYHGDKPNAVSCSEHVDRGALICVCLTNVPGLEVHTGDRFVCPEVYTHNADLYRDRHACSEYVCIMAGDQLQQIAPAAEACVHRVRNDLQQARLSISYELRVEY